MKKLLNTLYISDESSYLSLDGENIVILNEEGAKHKIPFTNIESIVVFNYKGCSPQLMGKCVEYGIALNFLTPSGKFLARVTGEMQGNVFLRNKQTLLFQNPNLLLMQNTVATKIANTMQLIKRSLRDYPQIDEEQKVSKALETLKDMTYRVYLQENREAILGLEGSAAKTYFNIFDQLILKQKEDFFMNSRTKRPPLDKVNALLSFLYTLWTLNYASALESVGLDSYLGFYHEMRSGRNSLACDLVEETRFIVERMVLTMINLKQIQAKDFEEEIGGGTFLNKEGKKKVLVLWQEKKQTTLIHPYLKQKVPIGLLPFVQSNLLAKYIRGEINEYPCLIAK